MSRQNQENPNTPLPEQDDALFQALRQSKKQRRRKRIRTAAIGAVVLIVALILGVTTLRRRVREQFAMSSTEVLSAQAQRGTISTLVSGSGVLANVDTEVVSAPAGVEITQMLVDYGDTVTEGQLLATADMATVRTAMSQLQEELDDLDDQIAAAADDKVSSYISAGVAGRVKTINAQAGDKVSQAVSLVRQGQEALVTIDALGGEHFTAQVSRISNSGTNEGGSSKFTVELTLEKSGEMLPGMTASAFLTVDTQTDVLCVPAAAVEQLGSQSVVYTGYDADSQTLLNPVVVTTGVSDGDMVEILDGLGDGSSFCYAYYENTQTSPAVPDLP